MSELASQLPQEDSNWLAGCQGFRVDSPSGRLGFVHEIRRDPESGRPEELVVRVGMFVRHHLVIPVDEITAVVPSKRIIVLRGGGSLEQSGADER